MDFGWKKKAERLRMTILSAGHQGAKDLPPGTAAILDLFRRVAESGDGADVKTAFDRICVTYAGEPQPMWEPADIHGWKLQATMYLDNGQLWWLLNAVRRNERAPTDKDVVFLDKILEHLGADPARDMIIGPRSTPAGHATLVFGWWTWFNRWPLFEIQTKDEGAGTELRVVPLGTRAADGYQTVDLIDDADEDKP